MKKLILFVCAAILVCCACDPNNGEPQTPDATITVTPNPIMVPATKGEVSVNVTASGAFQVFKADDVDWITKVSPDYSKELSTTVVITYAENLKFEERESYITIKVGTTRQRVPVVQEAAKKDDSIPAPEGYHLVWHDEFDGGSSLAANWTFENWAPGHVNNELQRYVAGGELDGKKTAEIVSDALHITALKHGAEVISARMNTRQSWKYGYMEAKIWLPKGRGTWPAFWMMPKEVDWVNEGWPKCGEIDIMEEVGFNPNYVSSSLHAEGHNHTNGTQVTYEVYCAGAESGYHIYAMEWTADYFQFYVDGRKTLYYKNDGKGVRNWPYDKAFYITLNLAWGGMWGGQQGVDESVLPATMKVDYVRVFQKD